MESKPNIRFSSLVNNTEGKYNCSVITNRLLILGKPESNLVAFFFFFNYYCERKTCAKEVSYQAKETSKITQKSNISGDQKPCFCHRNKEREKAKPGCPLLPVKILLYLHLRL